MSETEVAAQPAAPGAPVGPSGEPAHGDQEEIDLRVMTPTKLVDAVLVELEQRRALAAPRPIPVWIAITAGAALATGISIGARGDVPAFGRSSVAFVSAGLAVAIVGALIVLEVAGRLGWLASPADGAAPASHHPVLLGFMALSLMTLSLIAAWGA